MHLGNRNAGGVTEMLALMYAWALILGMNASLMGALWPVMYPDFQVALSAVGIFSWLGSVTGLISSLGAGWCLRRFGANRVTAASAVLVALSLLGYTLTQEYWMLCVLCIPYGLATGVIAVAANNYVALHYHSRHMSWVHCMWGIGSIIGPNLVAWSLRQGHTWHVSYMFVFAAWAIWAVAVIFLRGRWKPDTMESGSEKSDSLSLGQLLKIRGMKEAAITFFCYNSLEQGMMMWMSSYMVICSGISEELAATYASLFFIGITAGRMLNGILTSGFEDDRLIRIGEILIGTGIVLMLLPCGEAVTLAGFMFVGFGCAPVTPCLLHSTPRHFGKENSQAFVGVQVAASTLGNCILPSLFGWIANQISIALLPAYVFVCLSIMAFAHHRLSGMPANGRM